MSETADLPDLNVWLALAWDGHLHHQQALAYWEQQAAQRVLFCTVTALGLVRLLSQPKLMGSGVRSVLEASVLFQAFCQQPGVGLAGTDHQAWDVFHALLTQTALPPKHCTDAYLAALAMANGWRLVTFDRDFRRFAGLDWLGLA